MNETSGLDIRILSITIFLSLFFLCRALLDTLYAWNIFKADLQSPLLDIILIMLTEITPCFLMGWIMTKGRNPSGNDTSYESARETKGSVSDKMDIEANGCSGYAYGEEKNAEL